MTLGFYIIGLCRVWRSVSAMDAMGKILMGKAKVMVCQASRRLKEEVFWS